MCGDSARNEYAFLGINSEESYFLFYLISDQIVKREIKSISSSFKIASSITFTSSGSQILVGGCTSIGVPFISLISFTPSMSQIRVFALVSEEADCVNQLTKIDKNNLFVVGLNDHISTVEFDEKKGSFEEHRQLRNLHEGRIQGFVLAKNEIFSVGQGDEFIHRF